MANSRQSTLAKKYLSEEFFHSEIMQNDESMTESVSFSSSLPSNGQDRFLHHLSITPCTCTLLFHLKI